MDTNPFYLATYNGHATYHMGVDDRLSCVRGFDLAQCLAALALPDLQKTVRSAIERRQRALQRETADTLRGVAIGKESA